MNKLAKTILGCAATVFVLTTAHAEENVKMPGKMDMNLMKGMIHECMEKNKDEKLCHNNIMAKCEKNLAQNECQTMMTQSMKK